jgi:hypothetical protein
MYGLSADREDLSGVMADGCALHRGTVGADVLPFARPRFDPCAQPEENQHAEQQVGPDRR